MNSCIVYKIIGAIETRNDKEFKEFLHSGSIDPNSVIDRDNGYTLLMKIVYECGQCETMNFSLRAMLISLLDMDNIDTKSQDKRELTVFDHAVDGGALWCVEEILKSPYGRRLDWYDLTKAGRFIVDRTDPAIMDVVQRSIVLSVEEIRAVIISIISGKKDLLEKCLNVRPHYARLEINMFDRNFFETVLPVAARNRALGPPKSFLHVAIYAENEDAIMVLIGRPAWWNIVVVDGLSLLLACEWDTTNRVFSLLVRHCRDLNYTDAYGCDVFDYLGYLGRVAVARCILRSENYDVCREGATTRTIPFDKFEAKDGEMLMDEFAGRLSLLSANKGRLLDQLTRYALSGQERVVHAILKRVQFIDANDKGSDGVSPLNALLQKTGTIQPGAVSALILLLNHGFTSIFEPEIVKSLLDLLHNPCLTVADMQKLGACINLNWNRLCVENRKDLLTEKIFRAAIDRRKREEADESEGEEMEGEVGGGGEEEGEKRRNPISTMKSEEEDTVELDIN